MASDSFVQPAIPRFDGHYDHWSMLMENLLRSKEYWQVVSTGILEPVASVTLTETQRAELEGLKLKDLKEKKNYLFQAIDRSILETILCKETSKDIWDSMKNKYQGSSRTKRVQLQASRRSFETLQMKDDELVTSYCARTMAIASKMCFHGEKMEDVAIVEKILRSLAPKYNYVACSIEESKDRDNLSLDELQSSLVVHEQKMNHLTPTDEQALKASTPNRFSNPRGRGRGRGNGGRGRGSRDGGGRGNFRTHSDQPIYQNTDRNQHFEKSKVECFRCHKPGHYRSNVTLNYLKTKPKGRILQKAMKLKLC